MANLINKKFSDGDTMLIVAAKLSDIKLMKLLIIRGANTTIQNNDKKTMYDYLSPTMSDEIKQYVKHIVNEIDETGDTPLIKALKSFDVDLIESLLANGANALIKNKDGEDIFDCLTRLSDTFLS